MKPIAPKLFTVSLFRLVGSTIAAGLLLLVLRARINGNEMAGINGNEGREKEARAGLWG